MGKLTSFIYRAFIRLYKSIPCKKFFCICLRKAGISDTLYYKDLKFTGKFKVRIPGHNNFLMFHHGGSIENETFWKGLFVSSDNDTGWLWKQLCKCSDVVFDIGANTGIYSMVAKTLNPDSKVYAFEPSANTYFKLTLNNKINDYDIKCEQLAASNHSGEQVFYDTPDPNQTSASLSPKKLKEWEGYKGKIKEYKVDTITLSDYIIKNNIKKIDLVKIDVEMHEPEVIEGFGVCLDIYKPVVFIEILSEEVAEKLNKIININDYYIFHMKDNGIATRENQFSVFPGNWNFVFFHKDLKDKIKQCVNLDM